ncbi:MAG: hypothetical protein QOH61_2348 [Chloroflexota bacterium]|nr:hypothetical protein [Chloroflexota bacterium]
MRRHAIARRLLPALLASFALASLAVPAAAAANPANDAFANKQPIATLPYSDSRAIDGATGEASEPNPYCAESASPPDATVWYSFKPASTMTVRADTSGSGFSTEIAVYTGSSIGSLALVDCNWQVEQDDLTTSSLAWKALKNVTYRIQVMDDSDDIAGTLHFHVQKVASPSNDSFAHAKTVGSLPFHASLSNRNATYGLEEPVPGCAPVGATAWYTFTPSHTGAIQVHTLSSDYDTVLAVYRGTSVGSLAQVACNDDTSGGYDGFQSLVTFRAVKGRTYSVQVGGYTAASGDTELTIKGVTPPGNDAFAGATPLPPQETMVPTRKATFQAGEPEASCVDLPGATRWYTFVLGAPVTVSMTVSAEDTDAFGAIYSGSALSSLSEELCVLAGPGDSVALDAGTYHVQVGGADSDSGVIYLQVAIP